MMRIVAIVVGWLACSTLAAAQPGAPSNPAERVMAAAASAERSDWTAVESLASEVVNAANASVSDRGEANRLLGLAAYHHARHADAEAFFWAYLQLEIDGRLDPSLYPPELVGFFENVRATHAAELRALRPVRSRLRRSLWLNLLPPAGQFQNQQPGKGWLLAGLGAGMLAANLTSYLVLVRWCSDQDLTCEPDGNSRSDAARTLVAVNRWSGLAAIAVYAYGVIDGVSTYRGAAPPPQRLSVTPWSTPTGTGLGVYGAF